jgi:hypothetical protein
MSLDKIEIIWSMNKEGRDRTKGEKVDGEKGLLWFTKGYRP